MKAAVAPNSQGFSPYDTVIFCSNTVVGGGELIAFGGQFPVQVKKGDTPKVWLRRLSSNGDNSLVPVVEASKSMSPNIGVLDAFGGVVVVLNGDKILSVIERSAETVEIDFIDLRPLGLNIHGDSMKLQAGGMKLSGNSFHGVGTMLSLG